MLGPLGLLGWNLGEALQSAGWASNFTCWISRKYKYTQIWPIDSSNCAKVSGFIPVGWIFLVGFRKYLNDVFDNLLSWWLGEYVGDMSGSGDVVVILKSLERRILKWYLNWKSNFDLLVIKRDPFKWSIVQLKMIVQPKRSIFIRWTIHKTILLQKMGKRGWGWAQIFSRKSLPCTIIFKDHRKSKSAWFIS